MTKNLSTICQFRINALPLHSDINEHRRMNALYKFAGNKKNITFLIVFLAFFIKSLLFNISVFHGVVPTLIGGNVGKYVDVIRILISISSQLSIAIFIAGLVYIIKRDYWVLIVGFISDLWLVSNQIYFKFNDFFISVDSILQAGNLQDPNILRSVIPYLPGALIYPLITIVSFSIIVRINKNSQGIILSTKKWLISLCISFVFILPYPLKRWGIHYWILKEDYYGKFGYKCFIPFYLISQRYSIGSWDSDASKWASLYIPLTSIYHYFPAIFAYQMCQPDNSNIEFTEEEISLCINESDKNSTTINNPLIVVLVESLESWTINGSGQLANITNNLNRFSMNDNVLFCRNIKSQVKYGVSGDGQLIMNTGLLPTATKTVCQDYCDRTYPNFAGLFKKSFLINPWPNVWNQDTITAKYGYKQLIQSSNGAKWNDATTINTAIDLLKSNNEKSLCVFIITSSMHTPFDAKERDSIQFDKFVRQTQSDYLNCLSYTDKCIGTLLDYLLTDSLYSNATIVITGDHTIFKSGEFSNVRTINGANSKAFPEQSTYVPLMIYSPSIKGNKTINSICYQMDVFPTIMNCINATDYFWKGVGIDLLNYSADRSFDEAEAYDLSDRLIRDDYFAKHK